MKNFVFRDFRNSVEVSITVMLQVNILMTKTQELESIKEVITNYGKE